MPSKPDLVWGEKGDVATANVIVDEYEIWFCADIRTWRPQAK